MSEVTYRVQDFEPLILAAIAKYGPPGTDVLFVGNIHEECRKYGVPTMGSKSPIAQARGNPTGTAGVIVFQALITEREIRSVIAAMQFRRTEVPASIEQSAAAFVEHLTLHELAHLVNRWGNDMESACDEWANARLGSVRVAETELRKLRKRWPLK